MNLAGPFIQEMLILYCIGLLGFIVRKKGILNKNSDDVLTQLILYITLPALILFSLDISFSYTMIKDFFWLVSMSVYILIISIILARWMSNKSQLLDNQKKVYESLIIFGNQGFIGYAVIFILFKEQGIVYLTMFNIFYLILIWTYGIYLFTKTKEAINWKSIFLNPGILSTMTGLFIFLTPVSLPVIALKTLESVGKMTIPLSMMLIGVLMASISRKDLYYMVKNLYLWKVALLKLLLIPLLILPFIFFPVSFQLLLIAVLVSGMPSAPTISLYAQRFGADSSFASSGVLLTTLLCLFTIPFLFILLNFIY